MIRALAFSFAAWWLAGKAAAPVDGLLLMLSCLSAFVALGITAHKLGLGKELL